MTTRTDFLKGHLAVDAALDCLTDAALDRLTRDVHVYGSTE